MAPPGGVGITPTLHHPPITPHSSSFTSPLASLLPALCTFICLAFSLAGYSLSVLVLWLVCVLSACVFLLLAVLFCWCGCFVLWLVFFVSRVLVLRVPVVLLCLCLCVCVPGFLVVCPVCLVSCLRGLLYVCVVVSVRSCVYCWLVGVFVMGGVVACMCVVLWCCPGCFCVLGLCFWCLFWGGWVVWCVLGVVFRSF